MTSGRRLLRAEVRTAIQAELREVQERLRAANPKDKTKWSQRAVGAVVGQSQAVVNKAINYADVGPAVAEEIFQRLGTTAEELVAKHGTIAFDDDTRYPPRDLAIRFAALDVGLDLATKAADRAGKMFHRAEGVTARQWLDAIELELRVGAVPQRRDPPRPVDDADQEDAARRARFKGKTQR